MKPTPPPALLVLAAAWVIVTAASSKLIRLALVVKPSSTIRSTTLSPLDSPRSCSLSGRTLSRRSGKLSVHDLKGASQSNTSFRNSTNFHRDFPSRPAGPDHGEQCMQF